MPKSCPQCGGRKIGFLLRVDVPGVATGVPRCDSAKCGYIFKHIDKTEHDHLPVERRKRHTQAETRLGLYR